MIEIKDIKLSVCDDQNKLHSVIKKKLHLKNDFTFKILKRSIDARKKDDIQYVYTVAVYCEQEQQIVKKARNPKVQIGKEIFYCVPQNGPNKMKYPPVIVGAGPAGLFCGLLLAKQGYKPIIIERGMSVDERSEAVKHFWETGELHPDCNVQFGEGGAGTFSDGKLNTQVKDKYGRIKYVLETFVKYGAKEEIIYDNKPHIGTDCLINVVKGIRNEIIRLGGEVRFQCKVTDLSIEGDRIKSVTVQNNNNEMETILCEQLVLAIGHSARDTFSMLYENQLNMTAKDFAMGVRVEHLAKWIQKAMYGNGKAAEVLPAAPYKLTYQTQLGRGVYSFCMCPGGYVVNASSEQGYTAVNGMSYSGRDGVNSNTALIVTVKKDDFESDHPLAGIELQRKLEKKVYDAGNGKIVAQRFVDYCNNKPTEKFGIVEPQIKGEYVAGNIRECLPEYIADSIEEAMHVFGTRIPMYDHEDVVLSGVESRTSSPVRIERDETFNANISGIYPCGEGAGYAGGITSAAVDGLKVAEAIIKEYSYC